MFNRIRYYFRFLPMEAYSQTVYLTNYIPRYIILYIPIYYVRTFKSNLFDVLHCLVISGQTIDKTVKHIFDERFPIIMGIRSKRLFVLLMAFRYIYIYITILRFNINRREDANHLKST